MQIPPVLYQDALVLVVNKPAGIAVHAGPSGGPSLEDSFDDLRFGETTRPALAHRLDQDTSGCLTLGRNPKALKRLGKLFSEGRAKKTYWAVVRGQPPQESGRITFPLQKISSAAKGWRIVVDPSGKEAITDYRVMGTGAGMSWLALSPRTGRTHQLRVHLAQSGFPILGDPWYGITEDRAAGSPIPLHLHSRAIELPLYATKGPVQAEAPIPAEMHKAFADCGMN